LADYAFGSIRPTGYLETLGSFFVRKFLQALLVAHGVHPMPRLPMPPTNEEELKRNTTEQYAALGRFVEAFELMVNEVREICIERICAGIGSSERERLIEISFHNQSMTAKPLFDIMRAIIAEIVSVSTSPHYADRGTFKKVLSCIETEYSHLYNKRNELLHGTWMVGYVSSDDPGAKEFVVRKYKTTADGLAVARMPKNSTDLLDLVTRCDDTRTWLGYIDFCLQDKISINDFFKQERGEPWKFFVSAVSAGTTLPGK
jgi:hypothetical protein